MPPICKKKKQHLLSSIKQSIMKQGMPVTQAYGDGVFSRIEMKSKAHIEISLNGDISPWV